MKADASTIYFPFNDLRVSLTVKLHTIRPSAHTHTYQTTNIQNQFIRPYLRFIIYICVYIGAVYRDIHQLWMIAMKRKGIGVHKKWARNAGIVNNNPCWHSVKKINILTVMNEWTIQLNYSVKSRTAKFNHRCPFLLAFHSSVVLL